MGQIQIDQLLQPTSDGSPSGENLEYDSDSLLLQQEAQGKPERQMGEHKIAAEAPKWGNVSELALGLLKRTKDFRIAVHLASASLAMSDWTAFRDCLALMSGYIDSFWDTVHPQLDAEDDNDPTSRINALAELCDVGTVLSHLREAKLAEARGLGQVSLRLWQIASGELSAVAEDGEAPDLNLIHGVLMECDAQELEATAEAIAESVDLVRKIEKTVTDLVGAGQACSIEPLALELEKELRVLAKPLAERGLAGAVAAKAQGDGSEGDGSQGGAEAAAVVGEIRGREDVVRMLDQICKFYEQKEPSSPVPLLLSRAKRLASKSFLEIIQDLSPKTLDDVRTIGGIDGEKKKDSK